MIMSPLKTQKGGSTKCWGVGVREGLKEEMGPNLISSMGRNQIYGEEIQWEDSEYREECRLRHKHYHVPRSRWKIVQN